MAARPAPAFRGRSRERQELDRALDSVRSGQSVVLVIRGEAGIGKTALMHYCARQASGCRVARVTGVESELELPFAALHQLCQPLLGGASTLPSPQANALRVAFGLDVGSTPDRFVVGLATLSLLADATTDRPLVVLVDDAQWLDEPSAQVLGFVARRLLAEPVLALFAVREGAEGPQLPGLPELSLDGLEENDARALLQAAIPGHLDDHVRDRIVAETRGNPLGLLELPRGMSQSELAGGFVMPPSGSVSGQLHSRYLGRVQALPESTQRLILLAAADPTGDATLLWRAAATFNVGPEAAVAAEVEQLLQIGSRVQFRHPLVRSAAYAAASADDRGAAHLALAEATDAQTDPERRVWHLAAATTKPDETVAAELERSASTAQRRAGLAAAAAFLQRSVTLTVDPGRRADRALAAATASLHAGSLDAALGLVAEAAGSAVDDLQRARVEQLTGQIEAAARPGSEAPQRLLQAAKRLETLDVPRARETYLQAWWAAYFADRLAAPGGTLAEVCRAALSAPQPASPRPCDLLLDGLALVVSVGSLAARPLLRAAVDLFLADQVTEDDWIQWGWSATSAAVLIWDIDGYMELSTRQVQRVRDSGALSSLLIALSFHANDAIRRGDLEAATALIEEQNAVKEVTGIKLASYSAWLLAAYRGRPEGEAVFDDEAVEGEDGLAAAFVRLARAILYNGQGRFGEAVEQVVEQTFFSLRGLVLPELIEAATRAGRPDIAAEALGRLSDLVVPGSDWAEGMEARCRALLVAGDQAEDAFTESITRLGRTPLRLELARAHLLYGEWHRRENRPSAARQQLLSAYELFTTAGAEAFAERTRNELLATGHRVRQRAMDSNRGLTAQELHIARLAREGRTNPEIGAELYLSTRTVEWHLHKVFNKLDITSRRRLRDALPPSPGGS